MDHILDQRIVKTSSILLRSQKIAFINHTCVLKIACDGNHQNIKIQKIWNSQYIVRISFTLAILDRL